MLYNEHEASAIGHRLFQQACKMGLDGIVSTRRTAAIRPVHVRIGLKVKKP